MPGSKAAFDVPNLIKVPRPPRVMHQSYKPRRKLTHKSKVLNGKIPPYSTALKNHTYKLEGYKAPEKTGEDSKLYHTPLIIS